MAIPWSEYEMEKNLLDLSNYVEDPNRIAPQTNFMKPFGPSLWIVEDNDMKDDESRRQQRRRMVICGLQGGGGAWLWSPMLPPNDVLCAELEARCGGVRHIVCPSMYHYEWLEAWSKRYPKAKIYVAPPGLEGDDTSNVVVDFVLTDDPKRDFVLDLDSVLVRGSSTTEAVFYHRMSNTILVGDLIQEQIQIQPQQRQSWTEWLWGSSATSETKISEEPTDGGGDTKERHGKEAPGGVELTAQKCEIEEVATETDSSTKDRDATGDTLVAEQSSDSDPNNVLVESNNVTSALHKYYVPKTWQWSFWWKNDLQLTRNALKIILKKWQPEQLILSRGTCLRKGATQVIEDVFQWVPADNYMMYNDRLDPEVLGGFRSGLFTTVGQRNGAAEEKEEVTSPEVGDEISTNVVGPTTRTGMPLPITETPEGHNFARTEKGT